MGRLRFANGLLVLTFLRVGIHASEVDQQATNASALQDYAEPLAVAATDSNGTFARVLADIADPADVQVLVGRLQTGHKDICCGHWRHDVAKRLQRRISDALTVSTRQLGDVHLTNCSSSVKSGSVTSKWGDVAVIFLDEPEDTTVRLYAGDTFIVEKNVPRGTAVIVPHNVHLIHSSARPAAFVRIRRPGLPPRSFFEYYVASWISLNFVAPHDGPRQQKFLRAHTQHPKYWHTFFWSFVGMFFTVVACLPLAWWFVQVVESFARKYAPPVLPSGSTSGAPKGRMSMLSPLSSPEKRPRTLLPLVGADAERHQAARRAAGLDCVTKCGKI